MFFLSLAEHKFRLPPELLSLPLHESVKKVLDGVFVDKVISDLGLCVSIYDIKDISGGFIQAGDGASTYTVEFRMVIFRPFAGEVIVAKIKESDVDGLRCKFRLCALAFLLCNVKIAKVEFESYAETLGRNE
ncbi:DNA-directed RNA polymerase III subunit RPC8 [Linum perenne]